MRDNVLFYRAFSEDKYRRALSLSCLWPDIAVLTNGDLTQIGERGVKIWVLLYSSLS